MPHSVEIEVKSNILIAIWEFSTLYPSVTSLSVMDNLHKVAGKVQIFSEIILWLIFDWNLNLTTGI